MKFLIITAENEIYYTNELSEDVIDMSESNLLLIVDVNEELYLSDGGWVEVAPYE